MPNLNQPFAGGTLVVPGAYFADNVSAANPNPNQATPPLIFLGFGYSKPFTPVTYDTPGDLLAAIRGGPCAAFVPFLTNPSPQLAGAQSITFIDVGTNTQSALTLYSGVSGVINLKSQAYGLPSNLLSAQVQSASVSGVKLTLFDGYSGITAIGDNLGYPFQVAYTGTASGVVYNVQVSGGLATYFQTVSPNPGESLSIPLGSGGYATVTQLVEYLNGTGFYLANTVSSTNGAGPTNKLDAASGIALFTGAAPYTYVNVSSILHDVDYWVNQLSNGLATAASGAFTSSPSVALSVMAATPFSGASSAPPTQATYASGFNVALSQPGWTVFADSNASGVIALGVAHAHQASTTPNNGWRRFFSGSSLGDSVAQAVVQARSMNAKEACYVYPGIYANDPNTGINTLYSGLYAAAAACGMATGNPPATPLTNKALTATGVEVALTVSQIDQLQQAGVIPIWLSPQTTEVTIVSDFTTWQNDANPENVFTQQVACRWYLAYASVAALDPYVGTIAAPLTETLILNAVKKTLNGLIYSASNGNGVIAAWDPNSLQLIYTGATQLAAIAVSVQLVGQNRFITELVNVQPLNITISGGTSASPVVG